MLSVCADLFAPCVCARARGMTELLNEIFGFNGWAYRIESMGIDYCDELKTGEKKNYYVGTYAIATIFLKDGTYRQDIGYGTAENQPTKKAAIEKARKSAVTDSLKRTAKSFGNVLGLCLSDKGFLRFAEKQAKERVSMDYNNLRRPGNVAQKNPPAPQAPPASASSSLPSHKPSAFASSSLQQGVATPSATRMRMEDGTAQATRVVDATTPASSADLRHKPISPPKSPTRDQSTTAAAAVPSCTTSVVAASVVRPVTQPAIVSMSNTNSRSPPLPSQSQPSQPGRECVPEDDFETDDCDFDDFDMPNLPPSPARPHGTLNQQQVHAPAHSAAMGSAAAAASAKHSGGSTAPAQTSLSATLADLPGL
ncbi:hypothetical protein, variant 2, partial [Capsaspora owczarzaki ATCC 30864]